MNPRRPTNSHSRRQASVDHPRYPPQSTVQVQFQQNNPLVSDYDSDTPAYLSDYPSQPPRPTRTKDELNFSVLQRYIPDLVKVMSTAHYATIYDFNHLPEPAWSKSEIQGSLFICRLTDLAYGQERYIAFVLNRRGLDNFQAELCEGDNVEDNTGVEISDPFIIVSFKEGGERKINGIFISSDGPGTETERTRNGNAELMKSVAVSARVTKMTAQAAAAQVHPNRTNGHVRDAEATSDIPTDRKVNLLELFGQRRTEDSSWSANLHSPDGSGHQITPLSFDGTMDIRSVPQATPGQPDVLGDLFRRAGFGVK